MSAAIPTFNGRCGRYFSSTNVCGNASVRRARAASMSCFVIVIQPSANGQSEDSLGMTGGEAGAMNIRHSTPRIVVAARGPAALGAQRGIKKSLASEIGGASADAFGAFVPRQAAALAEHPPIAQRL